MLYKLFGSGPQTSVQSPNFQCVMKTSLKNRCLVWIVSNLERFPAIVLSQVLPIHLKLELLLLLPVVDICKLERTIYVHNIDLDTAWERCLSSCSDLKRVRHKLRRHWTAKELYFMKICSIAINCDLQLMVYRSTEAARLCKGLLFSAVDRRQNSSNMSFTPARYHDIEFSNTTLMQYIITECGYYPKTLIFTTALKLCSHDVVLEAFFSQVEHVIFDPNPFKRAMFPTFCAYITEFLFKSSLHLRHLEFFNCEIETWKYISPLLLNAVVNGVTTKAKILALKGIVIVHDDEVDPQDVETVAAIVAKVLLAQINLQEFHVSNWLFSYQGKHIIKLLSTIISLFSYPEFQTLGIENTSVSQRFIESILQTFMSCNGHLNQSLYLSNICTSDDLRVQTPLFHSVCDLSKKALYLCGMNLNIVVPYLLKYPVLNLQSMGLTYPKGKSQSVINDILTQSSLGSEVINLSGVSFSHLANITTCIMSNLCNGTLQELYLESCSLFEGNVLPSFASKLSQAKSLRLLCVCNNRLGRATGPDIKMFFAAICNLQQLDKFELDVSSNLLTCSHLKLFRDTLIDSGRECCLKKLTVEDVLAETDVTDETIHPALSVILEELSNEHKYSVISSNYFVADHIANM